MLNCLCRNTLLLKGILCIIYSNEYSKPQFYSLFEPFSSPIRPHNGIYFVTIEFFCGIQQCWQININFNIMWNISHVCWHIAHTCMILGEYMPIKNHYFNSTNCGMWFISSSNTAFQWTLKYSMWCKNKGTEYAFGWLKSSNYFDDFDLPEHRLWLNSHRLHWFASPLFQNLDFFDFLTRFGKVWDLPKFLDTIPPEFFGVRSYVSKPFQTSEDPPDFRKKIQIRLSASTTMSLLFYRAVIPFTILHLLKCMLSHANKIANKIEM